MIQTNLPESYTWSARRRADEHFLLHDRLVNGRYPVVRAGEKQ